jgi:hypothetical protein
MKQIYISIPYTILRQTVKMILGESVNKATFYRWIALAAPNKPVRTCSIEFDEYCRFVVLLKRKKTKRNVDKNGVTFYAHVTHDELDHLLPSVGKPDDVIALLREIMFSKNSEGITGKFFMSFCRAAFGEIKSTNFYSWAKRNGVDNFSAYSILDDEQAKKLFKIVEASCVRV